MDLHPSITPEVVANITKAVEEGDTADLYDSYCDNHKDAHGIKARWVYGRTYTAQEWVNMFSMLAHDVDAAIARDEENDALFRKRMESVGLAEWAERNNIRSETDLIEYNYHQRMRDYANHC
jgi:hypothetical protein